MQVNLFCDVVCDETGCQNNAAAGGERYRRMKKSAEILIRESAALVKNRRSSRNIFRKNKKKHGVYDFPHRQWGRMLLMCFLGGMVRNPKIKAKMGNKMNEGMAAPYEKVIRAAKPKK